VIGSSQDAGREEENYRRMSSRDRWVVVEDDSSIGCIATVYVNDAAIAGPLT